MLVLNETWGALPLLHVVQEEVVEQEVPVVIFLHGFTSAKEHNLHYAYNLAKQGIRVLLPDAHLHGERTEHLDQVQLSLRFWEIVLTSIGEVGEIYNEVKKRGLAPDGKIGVAGTSMGGIETLGCLAAYQWIDVAGVMMGSPGFVQLAKAQMAQFEKRGFKLPITEEERQRVLEAIAVYDLTKKRHALNKRPVHFWHGMQDTVVPFEPTHNFYKALKADYADVPERLSFTVEEESGHAVSRSGMLEAVDWLARHLNHA
ncbi:MAG TPA: alpha/beta fold hydrolase [Sporosarcina sp.]|nr:alpha/beta fold hydrolase [Sporosarcina sp.]